MGFDRKRKGKTQRQEKTKEIPGSNPTRVAGFLTHWDPVTFWKWDIKVVEIYWEGVYLAKLDKVWHWEINEKSEEEIRRNKRKVCIWCTPIVENIELNTFSFRCNVFTEEQLIIDARSAKNNFKSEAQRPTIKTLRAQIDILKNKCF